MSDKLMTHSRHPPPTSFLSPYREHTYSNHSKLLMPTFSGACWLHSSSNWTSETLAEFFIFTEIVLLLWWLPLLFHSAFTSKMMTHLTICPYCFNPYMKHVSLNFWFQINLFLIWIWFGEWGWIKSPNEKGPCKWVHGSELWSNFVLSEWRT